MSTSSLSDILLPAVFISSTVFSTLTVPLALIKGEPLVVELSPLFSGEIQPIFDGNHNEVAIPYIGFSIVVSVGAGMATVEVIRRWNQLRSSEDEEQQVTSPQPNLLTDPAQPEELKLLEYRPEVSAIDLSLENEIFPTQLPTSPDILPEEQNVNVEADQSLVDFPVHLSSPTPEFAVTSEKSNLSVVPPGNNVVQLESYRLRSQSAVPDLNFPGCEILASREQYQTCRIQIPNLQQRQLVITVQDEYYNFFRVEKTKEKVIEVLAKLGERVHKTMITQTQKGYVIWAKEHDYSENT